MKIDATNKSLGRLASKIATILQGKNKTDFQPQKEGTDFVEIKNVQKIKISREKLKKKVYYRHSGYPGGIKKVSMEELFKKNPEEVLKKAVFGMLPKNKLRKKRLKRLIFK